MTNIKIDHALIIGAAITLSACSTIPRAGPSAGDVESEYRAGKQTHPFQLIDVDAKTLDLLKHRAAPSLASRFGHNPAAPELLIGRGDGLTISIWEVGTQPLFSSTVTHDGISSSSARAAGIPEQFVGADGCISVPFVGRLNVAGHTTTQVQQDLERALARKAAKPQVLVLLTHNVSGNVTVIGEGGVGARVALSVGGDRLLDVLAASGGARTAAYETQVSLSRDGEVVTMPFGVILADPAQNIYLKPGDTLALLRSPRSFTAFGATGRNAQISFDAPRLNLVEAVAKAGGLLDDRADPRGIFLFRYEPAAVAEALDANTDAATEPVRPVVYRLDLAKAGGYFLAQHFELRDQDMLYVSNASAVELQKFLVLVGLVTQPAIEGAVLKNSVK